MTFEVEEQDTVVMGIPIKFAMGDEGASGELEQQRLCSGKRNCG